MSTFSDEMDALALELLTEFGQSVSFVRTTEGTYNPATGATGTATTTTFSGYGAPVDYDNKEIDNDIIKQGDSKLYVNAISTAPLPGDVVTLSSVDYRVMIVRKYPINGTNVLYELQIRI